MRILSFILTLFITNAATAQTVIPGVFSDYSYHSFAHNIQVTDSLKKKWSISKYAGLSAGYSFFKGGSAMVVAAPLQLQLNRRLNNNLYAFAGVAVAPTYATFSGNFIGSDFTKGGGNNSLYKPGNLGLSSRAELGLMYVNDARTFSISGSIGIERSNYRSYPVPYTPVNTANTNPAIFR